MSKDTGLGVDRRSFLKTSVAGGAGLMLSGKLPLFAVGGDTKMNDINVALVGVGAQGQVLMQSLMKMPGLNFVAVCDIWEKFNLKRGVGLLRKSGHKPAPYTDYREMLEKQPDLDAVIVATPDFWHAPITNACLKADIHVYCEKMMSNTHEGAVSMVRTAKEAGKLLQIGHQRRSNPRYQFVKKHLLEENSICGRITNVNGQWNRAVTEPLGWPERYAIDDAILKEYGFEGMHQFRNWRWFKGLGGGPISDLGAHQIDIYGWFLNANPIAVTASGGADYYDSLEWYDNVMAIYEFETSAGPVRAFYQVLTTTSAGGGYFEYFMGDEGSIKMSENPKYTTVFREANAPSWNNYVNDGFLKNKGERDVRPWEIPLPVRQEKSSSVDVRETAALDAFDINVTLDGYIHQPHLENFFNTVRGADTLNCPGEEALQCEAAVLKVNEAIEAQRRLTFTDADFHA
ncbi:MAG: Gfo/Idh/MocA family oxidoreductase [Verrucomicrobia bacterium]|nr:Gfo/Idh/MocA family oxidoreductase [Verrucomicrobiota bacterium]